MSSHHVVREAQEPALLILQSSALSYDHISPLLEWSPTILVTAEALPQVLEHGIKIDAVICRREEQNEISTLIQEQEPVTLISLAEEQDILSAALSFLMQHQHVAVNILTSINSAGREEIKSQLIEQELKLNVVLLDEKFKSALYRSGKFVKWLPSGEIIRLQPAQQEVVISGSGFTASLEQTRLQECVDLETTGTGVVSLNGSAPFWILEKVD